MRRVAITVLAIVAFGCGHGPKGLSGDVYSATVRAVSALERAGEKKAESDFVFDPLFIDVQKAVDEVRIVAPNSEVFHDLNHCVSEFKIFRLERQRIELELEKLEPRGPLAGSDKQRIQNEVDESVNGVYDCLKTVKEYE